MTGNHNRNKGYTLIELMVVLSIIALLLGLGISGIDSIIQWNKLSTTTGILSTGLKEAQSMAFYEGVYYKIQFWPVLDRYRIYRQTELIQDIILEGIDLLNTTFSDDQVYFYPNGTPSMGGTITLKNKRGKVFYIIMTPVTARIRVSSEPPESW